MSLSILGLQNYSRIANKQRLSKLSVTLPPYIISPIINLIASQFIVSFWSNKFYFVKNFIRFYKKFEFELYCRNEWINELIIFKIINF